MRGILVIVVLFATIAGAAVVLVLDARQRRLDRRMEIVLGRSRVVGIPSIRRSQADARWPFVSRLFAYSADVPYAWGPTYAAAAAALAAAAAVYGLRFAGLALLYQVLAALAAAVFVARFLFAWQRRQFVDRLFRQLPDTIEMVTSSVRSGLPVNEAFRALAHEMPQPTAGQFAIVCSELALGKPVEEAVEGVYRRTRLAEYGFFAVTLGVQIKAGGSLAETLQTLADTVRQRVAIAARAKALAGEVIFSSKALSTAPVLLGVLLYWINPETTDLLLYDPTGNKLLAYATVSVVIGNLLMSWMIRKDTSL